MLRENSKLDMIELPINRGFSYEKGGTLGEKTLLTLCKNRESSPKFTRILLFIKAYSYFFKSKWGFSFNLVWDQANGPRIKSSTFNYSFNLETSKHDSRSSFIALSDRNISWRSNPHIYTNQIQIDYLLHYFVIVWFILYENCVYSHLLVRIFKVRFIYLRPHYGDFLLLILIRFSYALYFSMQNSIVYRLASVHYFNPLLRKLESTFLSYESSTFINPQPNHRSIDLLIMLYILKSTLIIHIVPIFSSFQSLIRHWVLEFHNSTFLGFPHMTLLLLL